ncbi:hypothetical protein [uncultured Brevundimonas sp.]|uniref:hypothetical protein n=1 Tax=uncultured Brevundimonas sp. TaxID=213418 RepID=UPI0025F1C1C4|nr:hypothetical protein [uncultured Brevundimonas sp.]
MAKTKSDDERIAALKAAQAAQAYEEADLSLPRLQALAEKIEACRALVAEMEAVAQAVPFPNASTLLSLLVNNTLSSSLGQPLSLMASTTQAMIAGCEAILAPAETEA